MVALLDIALVGIILVLVGFLGVTAWALISELKKPKKDDDQMPPLG
jgi:hypothetical protein